MFSKDHGNKKEIQKQKSQRGEMHMAGGFNMSDAISSIEVRPSERERQKRVAALIPGFVKEKVNEITSEPSDNQSFTENFGTGDFPKDADFNQKEPQNREFMQSAFSSLSRNDFKFVEDEQEKSVRDYYKKEVLYQENQEHK